MFDQCYPTKKVYGRIQAQLRYIRPIYRSKGFLEWGWKKLEKYKEDIVTIEHFYHWTESLKHTDI